MRRPFGLALGFFLLGAAWSLLTPLGGVPDEPAHVIRASAVVTGQVITAAWAENPAYGAVSVPRYVAELPARSCFAFNDAVTPACFSPTGEVPTDLMVTGTSASLNSPLYYWLVGWPSLIASGDVAIYAMRLTNAALTAAALGIAVASGALLGLRVRCFTALIFLGLSPAFAYLAGSVNPNALEAATAAAVYMSSLSLFGGRMSSQTTRTVLAASLIVSFALLLNTRSIGFLWAATAIAIAYAQSPERPRVREMLRAPWLGLASALFAVAIASLLWIAVLPEYDQSGTPTIQMGSTRAAAEAFLSTGPLLADAIGMFGWLDTPAPPSALALWSAGGAVALMVTWLTGARRDLIAVALFLGVTVATPVVVQAIIAAELGYIWQGRYTAAPLLCASFAAAVAASRSAKGLGLAEKRVHSAVLLSVWFSALAHVVAAVHALRRYVTGLNRPIGEFVTEQSWAPPGGAWLAIALLIAAVVIAATLATASLVNAGRRTHP